MTEFEKAKNVKLPFGKFKGRTIDQAAETDEGLKYLDWLVGQEWVGNWLRNSLRVYLKDPTIEKELNKALGRF